jgi:hypothetical protein
VKLELALLVVLGSCVADVAALVDDGVGTVYTCTDGARTEEWCSQLEAAEVSALRALECHVTGIDDRWWPGLTNYVHGCTYGCESHRGCNARNGCLCPRADGGL